MPSTLSHPVDHPRPVDLHQTTGAIYNNFEGDSTTKDTYYQKIVIFMMWLFYNHQQALFVMKS